MRENVSKLTQRLKNGSNDFFSFWPKVLNMTFNLNETYFLEKFGDIWPRNRQNLVVFLQFADLVNRVLSWYLYKLVLSQEVCLIETIF